MRVAYLDMTNPNQQCPDEFRLITTPKAHVVEQPKVRDVPLLCIQPMDMNTHKCVGGSKPINMGNHRASMLHLIPGLLMVTNNESQHIWSFVIAHDEVTEGNMHDMIIRAPVFWHSPCFSRPRLFLSHLVFHMLHHQNTFMT